LHPEAGFACGRKAYTSSSAGVGLQPPTEPPNNDRGKAIFSGLGANLLNTAKHFDLFSLITDLKRTRLEKPIRSTPASCYNSNAMTLTQSIA